MRLLNASPALILLVGGILLILTGQPQAFFILVDAKPGSYVALCDGEQVAFVVEPGRADSVGLMWLPCDVIAGVWVAGEWVADDGGCLVEWGE